MTEIEKMYENAGIKKCNRCLLPCPFENECEDCEYNLYPDFTAEKQLELIKWLCQKTYRNYIHIRYERDINNWKIECNMVGIREFGNFDECFAGLINSLWQSLTDQEKEEIRRILNER